jgi:biotin carboxylase
MKRVLLLATTTGYQTRSFIDAAARLDVELVYATDCCCSLDNPWRDHATSIKFHEEERSLDAIVRAAITRPVSGILVVGDQAAPLAARVAAALGLPGHPPDAARASRDKRRCREALRAAGLPVPWFTCVGMDDDVQAIARTVPYPCVVKPLALSGSRGVIRANTPREFADAFARLRHILMAHEIRRTRDPIHDQVMVESFVPGREFALEGLLHRGRLQVLALFDKPDPLDGPFFEETIYLAPSSLPSSEREAIESAIDDAAGALGLWHGPIHAECRVNSDGVFVLEVAARPIGGLCSGCLRFESRARPDATLEELLLRHALGEDTSAYRRERLASGVMMVPIPRRGVYRGVSGVEAACRVPAVEEVRITAKPDQMLTPLPEGASYLGFIFARAAEPSRVDRALREAHRLLEFTIDAPLEMCYPLRC